MGKKKTLRTMSEVEAIEAVEEGYQSESTVDNPPKFNADGQVEVPGTEEDEAQTENLDGKFKFSLVLVLNDGVSGAEKLAIIGGEAPGNRIEEILNSAIKTERFQRKLRGFVGEPLFGPESGQGKENGVEASAGIDDEF